MKDELCGWSRGQTMCFYCLECICGWRAKGSWNNFQRDVCGPCLRRIVCADPQSYGATTAVLGSKVQAGEWARPLATRILAHEARKVLTERRTAAFGGN